MRAKSEINTAESRYGTCPQRGVPSHRQTPCFDYVTTSPACPAGTIDSTGSERPSRDVTLWNCPSRWYTTVVAGPSARESASKTNGPKQPNTDTTSLSPATIPHVDADGQQGRPLPLCLPLHTDPRAHDQTRCAKFAPFGIPVPEYHSRTKGVGVNSVSNGLLGRQQLSWRKSGSFAVFHPGVLGTISIGLYSRCWA